MLVVTGLHRRNRLGQWFPIVEVFAYAGLLPLARRLAAFPAVDHRPNQFVCLAGGVSLCSEATASEIEQLRIDAFGVARLFAVGSDPEQIGRKTVVDRVVEPLFGVGPVQFHEWVVGSNDPANKSGCQPVETQYVLDGWLGR